MLALLLTAVTGAWAQSTYTVTFAANGNTKTVENVTLPKTFQCSYSNANGELDLILKELYGWTGDKSETVCANYSTPTSSDANKVVAGKNGNEHYITIDNVFEGTVTITGEYYVNYSLTSYSLEISIAPEPEPTEWELTPDADKKVWTLATMPAGNVLLNVEYEPTKVTMAANDNTMGTVEVGGESKVEWTAETWQGWTKDTKTYTVGDITMTSSQSASIQQYNANFLDFFVNEWEDNSTVTFSTTGEPFTRIEFAMTNVYDPGDGQYNHGMPNIQPADGWTFSDKSAVWEGEATKSLTLQSCSTTVSKITFFKGGVPEGVTVNTDGTFTVAKTATVTLTATPKEGYKFLYWDDDHSNTNPVREVTIEPGEADKTYTAVFAEILYNVTFADGIEDADKWSATPNTNVKKEDKVDIEYTGAKKVIGVKAAKKAPLIVNPVVGQIIGSDGKNYDANATLPDGVKAVAVIAYVGSETGDDTYKNGLAIALADESSSMNWSTAKSTCEGKTAIAGAKWCLPSQDQLKQMFKANGGIEDSYTGLNTIITTAGGTILQDYDSYWSSSEAESGVLAWYVYLAGMANWSSEGEDYYYQARACLAF